MSRRHPPWRLSRDARASGVRICAAACLILAGCASAVAGVRTPSPSTSDAVPPSLRWSRSSAEHRALYLEIYGAATAALPERARGYAPGAWAVILDADETVLDNAAFEQQRMLAGRPFAEVDWDAWVRRAAAPALPGAAAFTRQVRADGGRVVIVSNRRAATCDATEENLRRADVVFDEVLCKPDAAGDDDDKEPRFQAVVHGTAPSTLPPLAVVMWIGDNIRDFPGATQVLRTTSPADTLLRRFGSSWFLVPNPLYGSWEHNPLP